MSDKVMSRRKFLLGAGAVVGVASVSGLGLAGRPSTASADGAPTPLPWPYDPTLDPTAVAKVAFETYYASGCAEATWWAPVAALAASPNIPNAAATWGTIPKNMFRFGGGGVDSWGTICGTLNGSCAVIAMTGADATLEDAIMEYYGDTPLPTNATDIAYRAGGWKPATAPMPNVVTSTSHSQLCHSSLSQWAMAAGHEGADTSVNAIGKPGQKDRCAKLCFDLTFKTVTLLNAYFLNNAKVLPVVKLDPSVAACKTCHTPNAMGKMACEECHDVSDSHPSGN